MGCVYIIIFPQYMSGIYRIYHKLTKYGIMYVMCKQVKSYEILMKVINVHRFASNRYS